MKKSFFNKLFPTKQERDIKKLRPIIDQVNSLESWAKSLNNEDFKIETENLKSLAKKDGLDAVLTKAFALAREAALRVLGERPYDVQIMGACVLHQGKILEMKTGEGKTLTCVPAAYLNALSGKKVHVITVNDYLAERDSQWMGRVYKFLGLSVGCILSNMDNESRRIAYESDITYGTNNEFGFDYLRDNMKWDTKEKIQPEHNYCIIDEIDSILIDEARTPLIISGSSEDDSKKVIVANLVAPGLIECEKDPKTNDYYEQSPLDRFNKEEKFDEKGDFKIDEKRKRITFTSQGMIHIEKLLQRAKAIEGSLYSEDNFELVHYVTQAVTALKLYNRDTDYMVRNGKVEIVDEFTGRVLEGRRYSDGLHQAIEAKERIKILGRNRTLATITFQNFFRMYDKLSGMTGTADTEAGEFLNIYNLDVVVIPTNKPLARIDDEDVVYYNEEIKLNAIIEEIKRVHKKGQPILVGTASIEKSEILSSLLKKHGIKHEVLNAKNHEREAHIIENAGALGSITISTNMAGRGTDIKLGGSYKSMALKNLKSDASEEEIDAKIKEIMPLWKEQYEKVKELGGLYILGTERHESRRIDNQLRGRSGRQGDPGYSRFYLSLDDNLIRLFASDSIRNLLAKIGMQDGEPLVYPMLSRGIEKAQNRVEDRNFEIRKHLLEYDDVLNEQRNYIYTQRDTILNDNDLVHRVLEICKGLLEDELDSIIKNSTTDNELFININKLMQEMFKLEISYNEDEIIQLRNNNNLNNKLAKDLEDAIMSKVELAGNDNFNSFLRWHYLKQVDSRWQDHLDNLEALREAVYLRSYAQKNPLNEYKHEGFTLFDALIENVRQSVARALINVKVEKEAERDRKVNTTMVASHSSTNAINNSNAGMQKAQVVRTTKKVGRNEPCPCGSGKKYKHCCGNN